MASSIGFGRERSCALCDTTQTALRRFALPFFEDEGRGRELCGRCIEALESDGAAVAPITLEVAGEPALRWVGPTAEDAEFFCDRIGEAVPPQDARLASVMQTDVRPGADLPPLHELWRSVGKAGGGSEMQALFATHAWRRSRVELTTAAQSLSDPQREALQAAKQACLLAAPYRVTSELDVRIAIVRIAVTIALGTAEDARKLLDDATAQALQADCSDCRLHLMAALLHARAGHSGGLDRALARARDELQVAPGTAEVEAAVWFDTYARAAARQQWPAARDALASACALQPDDRDAARELARIDLKLAGDGSASTERLRRVCAEYGDAGAADLEAVVLRASALALLGAHHEVVELVRSAAEAGSESADLDHLAGVSALALGDLAAALRWLMAAFRAAPRTPAVQQNLWCALRRSVLEAIETGQTATSIAELIGSHRDLLRARFGAPHLKAMTWLLLRELHTSFNAAPSLGVTARELEAHIGDSTAAAAQTYGLLAQRDVARALEKGSTVCRIGAPAIPFVMLGQLLDRARSLSPLEMELVTSRLKAAFEVL